MGSATDYPRRIFETEPTAPSYLSFFARLLVQPRIWGHHYRRAQARAPSSPGSPFALDALESHVPSLRTNRCLIQNAEVDRLELPRIQDDDELEALKASGALQPIIAGESLRFDPRLDPSRRFCRLWTRDFVQDIAQAYYNRFHAQIQVNSAVRTVKGQKKLRRHNRNAAPAEGDTASSHLAGLNVDLQRRGMTQDQIHWVERYLFYMKSLGLVEPEEERHQLGLPHHGSGRYAGWRETQDVVPMERPEPAAVAASAREPRRIAISGIAPRYNPVQS